MTHLLALLLGFLLDILIGDPHGFPHLVIGIGKLITALEKLLRGLLPNTQAGQLAGGGILVFLVCLAGFGLPFLLLWLCGLVSPWLSILAEGLLCWQCIALHSLKKESLAVYTRLEQNDLTGARQAVAMIVGRDTNSLDAPGIARATVETVAENASDGVIAPLFFMLFGGAPLGVLYKAINTMDSMLGYKNEQYLYFGRAAALLDDVVNYLPARLCALFAVAAARLFKGFDGAAALRVYKRDHANHKSPNSAHPEAAFAGAMGLQLGGSSYYFGKLVEKPTIGDDTHPIQPEDIPRSCRLLNETTGLFFAAGLLIAFLLVVLF